MTNDCGNVIHRMMRQSAEGDSGPNTTSRCEGHGQRVEEAPHKLRASNGSVEIVMYYAECQALATMVDAEDPAIGNHHARQGQAKITNLAQGVVAPQVSPLISHAQRGDHLSPLSSRRATGTTPSA
jgi:hypothetical protein